MRLCPAKTSTATSADFPRTPFDVDLLVEPGQKCGDNWLLAVPADVSSRYSGSM